MTTFLEDNNINYVNKNDKPTEVPQCRSVEDFFGFSVVRVYHRNRQVRDLEALTMQIRKLLQIFHLQLYRLQWPLFYKNFCEHTGLGP